jgi:hypothetical protein
MCANGETENRPKSYTRGNNNTVTKKPSPRDSFPHPGIFGGEKKIGEIAFLSV